MLLQGLGPLQPLETTQLFWGSSLSQSAGQPTSQKMEDPQDDLLHSWKMEGQPICICFPEQLPGQVAPTETKNTNEGKECRRSTRDTPVRRTFGSLGGRKLLSISKMVPKPEAQVYVKLSASAFKHADTRTDIADTDSMHLRAGAPGESGSRGLRLCLAWGPGLGALRGRPAFSSPSNSTSSTQRINLKGRVTE